MTFSPEIVSIFDAFFLLGPMHRQAFNEYLQDFNQGYIPDHLDLFDIGYPKSDGIINGYYNKTDIIWELALDPHKKTILYAPAFNEGASLREYGLQVIELLASQSQYNVIVKLPIDCYQPLTNLYATGGINWVGEVKQLEDKYMNLTLYNNQLIDPILVCADVLITCISTVGFEFMALNQPVIFIDTPKYYSGYLKRRFPDKDTVAWSQRTTANGGKEFGLVVKDVQDLPQAIDYIFTHPGEYPKQQEKLKTYLLYNKGRGAQAAVDKINALLNLGVKSKRPITTLSIARYYLLKMWDKL
jgi:CDP-glycerol glycerophosphotransferase (TagB/SpsB family)